MSTPRRSRPRPSIITAVMSLCLAVGVMFSGGLPAQAAPAARAAVAAPTGTARPWYVDYHVWQNHIYVYRNGKLVRDIAVAGNPYLRPKLPEYCRIADRARVGWDKTYVWRLDYFTRLCPGRGVGIHDIPVNRYNGRRSMTVAGLGHTPGVGSPLSHGCARAARVDAEWFYRNVPSGTLIHIH